MDVVFSPPGVTIINEEDSVLACQLKGGVNLTLTEQLEIYGGLRWRQTDDLQVAASLLAEVGTRWQF